MNSLEMNSFRKRHENVGSLDLLKRRNRHCVYDAVVLIPPHIRKVKDLITLGNNFLHFQYSLDFYNVFKVFLHCWIRKWHPFVSIRSGFCDNLIWKKFEFSAYSIKFSWHHQLIFVHTNPKYVFEVNRCFFFNVYLLPDTNID